MPVICDSPDSEKPYPATLFPTPSSGLLGGFETPSPKSVRGLFENPVDLGAEIGESMVAMNDALTPCRSFILRDGLFPGVIISIAN